MVLIVKQMVFDENTNQGYNLEFKDLSKGSFDVMKNSKGRYM